MSLDESLQSGFPRRRDRLFETLSNKKVMAAMTIVPAFALFLFVNLFPIAWAFTASFFEISAFAPGWEFTGLSNYEAVLSRPAFWESVRLSFVYAVGTTALQLVFGVGFALLLNRPFRYNYLARAIGMMPYLVPTAVVGFIASWMANSNFGIINQILTDLGLIDSYIAWFGNPDLAMLAVILATSWKFSIFVTIMTLSRLQAIPGDLYDAATMAGASRYQQFRDVTLPNLKGVIFIVLLLRAVWQFNQFDIIYVLTRGGPLGATTTTPVFAFETSFPQTQIDLGAAISVLLFGMLIVFAGLYFRVLEPSEEVRVE